MSRILSLSLLFILFGFVSNAQKAEPVIFSPNYNASRLACADQKAGTITINGNAPSVADTVFLCAGSKQEVKHNGDANLTGDPDTSTKPGVVYAQLSCSPSKSGSITENDLKSDDCYRKGSSGNILVVKPKDDYSFELDNESSAIRDAFGGSVVLYYMPITIDDFENRTYEDGGSCIHASGNMIFPTAYMAPIALSNVSHQGLSGNFQLSGGYPDFNNSAYTVSISNTTTNEAGTIAYNESNQSYLYTIPSYGDYEIIVSDAKGCQNTFTFEAKEVVVPSFCFPEVEGKKGDTICVPITVQNLEGVVSLEIGMAWDPNILSFVRVQNVHPNTNNSIPLGDVALPSKFDQGRTKLIILERSAEEFAIPDGETLIEVCFGIIGEIGDVSPLSFEKFKTTDIKALIVSSIDTDYDYNTKNGQVTVVDPGSLSFRVNACKEPDSTEISITNITGTSPFVIEVTDVNSNTVISSESITGDNAIYRLPNSDYDIKITDNTGNSLTKSISLTSNPLDFQVSLVSPDCNRGASARIISISGGNPVSNLPTNYYIEWDANGRKVYNVTEIDDIPPGTLKVSVRDQNNCIADTTISVTFEPLMIENFQVVDTTECGSTIEIGATGGGTSLYYFKLDKSTFPPAGPSLTGRFQVDQGKTYTVIAGTDPSFSCSDSLTFTGIGKGGLPFTVDTTHVSCNGVNDGRIIIDIKDPNPNETYNVIWQLNFNNNETLNDATHETMAGPHRFVYENILPETYRFRVLSSQNCNTWHEITITEPEVLDLQIDQTRTHGISCNGDNDGAIFVTSTGGNQDMPLLYRWSSNITSEVDSATQLSPGIYAVKVFDHRNCQDSLIHEIVAPSPITFDVDEVSAINCNGELGALGVINVMGGVGQKNFSIDGSLPQLVTDSIPIGSGEHTVVVTDMNGCTASQMYTMSEPPPMVIENLEDVEVNLGESIDLNPNVINMLTNRLDYLWSGIEGLVDSTSRKITISPISSGTATFKVTDEFGCMTDKSIMIDVRKRRAFRIPNAFTPNNDGYNDKMEISLGSSVQKINSLQVYDRWGNLFFERKEVPAQNVAAAAWDGNLDGQPAATGVYLVLAEVEYLDGKKLLFRFDLTLIR